jgi:hypothetical protein
MTTTLSNNPFAVAKERLIATIAAMPAPGALVAKPEPGDFYAINKWMRDLTKNAFDQWIADVGHQLKHAASYKVDMSQFEDVFSDAIEGNATWEVDQAADLASEGMEEECVF